LALSIDQMRQFLSRSYSSVNRNKVNGIYAEVAFYNHLAGLGYGDKLSPGGWIIRPTRVARFGLGSVAVFPDGVPAGKELPVDRLAPPIPPSVEHAATFLRHAGIATYFCYPVEEGGPLRWIGVKRGDASPPPASDILHLLERSFVQQMRFYNYLRHHSDVTPLNDEAILEQFPLESLRIYIRTKYYAEISDIDRLIWGQQTIYPVEVKEKTRPPSDRNIGDWFGLDVGPFTKLAFFKAWYGQLDALFVVREIKSETDRSLVQWWVTNTTDIAKYASWVFSGGGPNMAGGASAVIKVPIHAFRPLDETLMAAL